MGKIKYIFLVYLIITLVISLLLYFPITHNEEKLAKENPDYNYSDALFIAASAFSDTGLSMVTISDGFNMFGQTVIAIGILIGGFGFFTIKLYIFQIILSKFGWHSSSNKVGLTQVERGSTVAGDTKKLIQVSLTTLISTILIGTFILTFYFYFSVNPNYISKDNPDAEKLLAAPTQANIFNPRLPDIYNPHGNWGMSIRYAIFHCISGVNNAGFDIIGPNSINVYYNSYLFQIIIFIMFFIGGVGYPTIYDIFKKIKSKFTATRYRVTLFTKLNLTTWLLVTTIGILLTFAFEISSHSPTSFWHQEEYGSYGAKSFAIFFNTLSTRSAGFSTVDYYAFTQQTQIVHALLMFIGFAPASTAGGIRNLTLAIIILSIFSVIRGDRDVVAFKRKVAKETLIKAVNIFAIGLILIFIGTLVVSSSAQLTPEDLKEFTGVHEKHFGLTQAFFEVCSAFGSSGLSTGLTNALNLGSKITLILLMFIGQLGITSTVLIWGKQNNSIDSRINNIREDISLG